MQRMQNRHDPFQDGYQQHHEMNSAKNTFQHKPTTVETMMRRSTGTKVKLKRPTMGHRRQPANFRAQNF
jgi:hypothetical protein